jgi:branched-chain amino acid transport system permease protein
MSPRHYAEIAVLAAFAAVPPVMGWLDQPFYLDLAARIMIFAIAAVSLDLILGFGGMVSFGHAAYIGIGAYCVAIPAFYGLENGWLQFALAIVVSAGFAAVIGAVCLRTSGVYFIMITLAFAQMLFYLGISLEAYGGDDGLPAVRSDFGLGLNLYDAEQFYYLVFVVLVLTLLGCGCLVASRFGLAVRGTRSNPARMAAIGFPTYRYRLVCFVIAGAICGLAGALFANLNEFTSPAYMHWTRSGELIVMVVMGGMATLLGPVLGATLFLLLEEFLPELIEVVAPGYGDFWGVVFGPILILIVLFGRGGIHGIAARLGRRHG